VSRLIRRCDVVVAMDDAGSEIEGGSILIDDGVITWVGSGEPPEGLVSDGLERIDGTGAIALPGLVNAHHHLFQTLTRARAQDQGLFGWLRALYPVWAGLDQDWELAASRLGLAELALSGCSTTTDHHYLFPPGAAGILEAEIGAAREVGLRFHPCRGSMDMGISRGGLPPDSVVEDTDDALAAAEDAVGRHHDAAPGSLLRIAVAPCSPFSVTERLMRESASLARRLGVRLHTHVAETLDEEAYCIEAFDRRPIDLLDEWGWLGRDVWLAHGVHLDDKDVRRIAETGTGVAWCPTSNLRLGSGIAPGSALLREGAVVGLGVDGSASNDAGNLMGEARQALLVSRARGSAGGLGPRDVLRMATRGGAACLGREDIGSLQPGMRADVALFAVDDLAHAGTEADPVAGVVLGSSPRVRHLVVEGRDVVRDGYLVNADEEGIVAEACRVAGRISAAVTP
jgi:cytosine/adenosine deaminase-related metal-dependent hydrolase